MSNSAGVSIKAEDAYPTGAPGHAPSFSVVRVAHLLLLPCMYDFSHFMFFVMLCSMSFFHVWSLSMGCILLITAMTLVPLITLSILSYPAFYF